jgi:hypothetical protein
MQDENLYWCANCNERCNMLATGHYDPKTNKWICKKKEYKDE